MRTVPALIAARRARLWLRSPNPELDWKKPLELIADGEYRRVIGAARSKSTEGRNPLLDPQQIPQGIKVEGQNRVARDQSPVTGGHQNERDEQS